MPFEGGLSTIMHKALTSDPPRPSQLSTQAPPRFDIVVATAMAKTPAQRFRSAGAFAEALQEALDATIVMPPKARTPPPRGPEPRAAEWPVFSARSASTSSRDRSRIMLGGLAALATLGVVGVAAWVLLAGPSPHRVAPPVGPAASTETPPPPAAPAASAETPPPPPTDAPGGQATSPVPAIEPTDAAAPAAPDTAPPPSEPSQPAPPQPALAAPEPATAQPPAPETPPPQPAVQTPGRRPSEIIVPPSQLPPDLPPRRVPALAEPPRQPPPATARLAPKPPPAAPQKDTSTLSREYRAGSGRTEDKAADAPPARQPQPQPPPPPLSAPQGGDTAYGYFGPNNRGLRTFSPTQPGSIQPGPTQPGPTQPGPTQTGPTQAGEIAQTVLRRPPVKPDSATKPAAAERPASLPETPPATSDSGALGYFRTEPDGRRVYVPAQ